MQSLWALILCKATSLNISILAQKMPYETLRSQAQSELYYYQNYSQSAFKLPSLSMGFSLGSPITLLAMTIAKGTFDVRVQNTIVALRKGRG